MIPHGFEEGGDPGFGGEGVANVGIVGLDPEDGTSLFLDEGVGGVVVHVLEDGVEVEGVVLHLEEGGFHVGVVHAVLVNHIVGGGSDGIEGLVGAATLHEVVVVVVIAGGAIVANAVIVIVGCVNERCGRGELL